MVLSFDSAYGQLKYEIGRLYEEYAYLLDGEHISDNERQIYERIRKQAAGEVAELVRQVPGTIDVSDGIEEKTTELRLQVNKKKATKYNLTTAQVYQFLQGKLSEAGSSTTLNTDEKDYDVTVIDDRDESLTRERIKKLNITGTDADGKEVEVPISKLVEKIYYSERIPG